MITGGGGGAISHLPQKDKMIPNNKVRVFITMPKNLNKKLDKLAKLKSKFRRTTKSDIVNELVEDYFNSNRN